MTGACTRCREKKFGCSLQPKTETGRPDRKKKTADEVLQFRLSQMPGNVENSTDLPDEKEAEEGEGSSLVPSPSSALSNLGRLNLSQGSPEPLPTSLPKDARFSPAYAPRSPTPGPPSDFVSSPSQTPSSSQASHVNPGARSTLPTPTVVVDAPKDKASKQSVVGPRHRGYIGLPPIRVPARSKEPSARLDAPTTSQSSMSQASYEQLALKVAALEEMVAKLSTRVEFLEGMNDL